MVVRESKYKKFVCTAQYGLDVYQKTSCNNGFIGVPSNINFMLQVSSNYLRNLFSGVSDTHNKSSRNLKFLQSGEL